MVGQLGQAGRVAKQHQRAAALQARHIAVEPGRRDPKGRQQVAAQQAIAQAAQTVLRAQLDRTAPQHQLGVADVHPPPARGTPLGGHIVALAALADPEHQRLARGAARGVALHGPMAPGQHARTMGAHLAFAQQWQGLQIGHRLQALRLKAMVGKQLLVVRHARAYVDQECAQPGTLVCLQLLRRPPLHFLQGAQQGHRVVALQALLQRKQQLRAKAGVEAPLAAHAAAYLVDYLVAHRGARSGATSMSCRPIPSAMAI